MTGTPLTRLGVARSGVTRTGDTADGYRVASARRLSNPLSVFQLALVMGVVGLAAGVAVPEYLNLRRAANDDAARARLSAAARTLEARHAAAGAFAGAALPPGVRLQRAHGSYCIETTAGDHVWHASRHGTALAGACPGR
jgi:hypothetical protein